MRSSLQELSRCCSLARSALRVSSLSNWSWEGTTKAPSVTVWPTRLPQAARTVGYWVGKARRYIEGVKTEVEREFDSGELKRILHNQEVQIKELQSKLNQSEDYVNQEYHDLFDDKDDPGTDKTPRYEILEEDDEEDLVTEPKADKQQQTDKPATTEKPE